MKIQTFSIVVGTEACNAGCQFCVSHTTGFDTLPPNREINKKNLHKASILAKQSGCTTVLLTGKGEPTLYPDEITKYLKKLQAYDFPFIELQTNAIQIGHEVLEPPRGDKMLPLHEWSELGLNTVAISVVDIDSANNQQVYLHHRPNVKYPDLQKTVERLHTCGFSVRLCLMMHKGMIDSFSKVEKVAEWCKKNGVEQLTIRPIRRPLLPVLGSDSFQQYINNNGLTETQITNISLSLTTDATHILTLMNGAHKAKVYDLHGQNICLSDCLTVEPVSDDIRTLIFFSDGKLFFDWQFTGARLL